MRGATFTLGVLALLVGASWPLGARRQAAAPPSTPAGSPASGELRIGSVSASPGEEIERFLPLREYLAPRLRAAGIEGVRTVVARSLPEMAAWMREGKVDLFVDSPFPSLLVRRLAKTRFLLRRWKKGVGEYRPVLFARKDSGLRAPEDLRGRTIAFEEPYSSTGYFFPKARLLDRGLRLVPRRPGDPETDPEAVGFVFSGADENTLLWVLRGKVAAGAMDAGGLARLAEPGAPGLVLLDEGPSLPRQIVSAREGLGAALVERLRALLLGMEGEAEGRAALERFERTARFDEIPLAFLPVLEAFEHWLAPEVAPR